MCMNDPVRHIEHIQVSVYYVYLLILYLMIF